MSDTERKGPFIPDQREEVKNAEAMVVVADWLHSLEWPDYVGRFQLSNYGYVWAYPTDITEGFPKHFQKDVLRLMPFDKGKLKRDFREYSGEIYWVGEILVSDLPEAFVKRIGNNFPQIRMIFECGTKTECKLIKKTREETYFELDCSDQARAEVKASTPAAV